MFCRRLVDPIHRELRKQTESQKAQYATDMLEYNLKKMKDFNAEKPVKPAERTLFIPANNSATGVFQLLAENEGRGLIFETESDTLAIALKTDYGNYSDGFRKAFHHETISYNRRTDREFAEIDEPRLSTVLSSTPRQVALLIPNAENGLFSRFIFYHINFVEDWKNDVLDDSNEDGLEGYYNALGQEFLQLYKALGENPAIRFRVPKEQHTQFDVFFSQLQKKYLMLLGMDYVATVRRLGLIAFRIAMIFTALRIMETGELPETLVCSDTDFDAALSMIQVLVRHSSHVYSELPADHTSTKPKDRKKQFFDKLPARFNHLDFLNLAESLGISKRTAETYINNFCEKGLILRQQRGDYINLAFCEQATDSKDKAASADNEDNEENEDSAREVF